MTSFAMGCTIEYVLYCVDSRDNARPANNLLSIVYAWVIIVAVLICTFSRTKLNVSLFILVSALMSMLIIGAGFLGLFMNLH
jgi:hypothetical protein